MKNIICIITLLSTLFISCEESIVNQNSIPSDEELALNNNFIELTNITVAEVERFENFLHSLQKNDRRRISSELKKIENNVHPDQLKVFSKIVSSNDEFIRYTENRNSVVKKIFEDYPSLDNLDKDQLEEKFISATRQILSSRNKIYANLGVGNCTQIYNAELQSATASSIVMLVGCGAAGGATVNPVTGGAIYGLCSGAVYAWLDAQVEIAEAEYENCIDEE